MKCLTNHERNSVLCSPILPALSWGDTDNCFDDAMMMSVSSTQLNAEFVHHHCKTCAADPRDLFALIGGFYNRTRLHSASNISAMTEKSA